MDMPAVVAEARRAQFIEIQAFCLFGDGGGRGVRSRRGSGSHGPSCFPSVRRFLRRSLFCSGRSFFRRLCGGLFCSGR